MLQEVKSYIQIAADEANKARARGEVPVGAVLVDKNSVMSVGNNSYKTHPIMATRTELPYLHAEQHAIIRRGLDNCDNLDLYNLFLLNIVICLIFCLYIWGIEKKRLK